jgi:hypothetical protein
MPTTKLYLCYYDEITGSREECNVFYSKVVSATTKHNALIKFIRSENCVDPNCKVTKKDMEAVDAIDVEVVE